MFDSKSSSGWSATAPSRHYNSSWESLTQGNFDKLFILTPHYGGLPLWSKKDRVIWANLSQREKLLPPLVL